MQTIDREKVCVFKNPKISDYLAKPLAYTAYTEKDIVWKSESKLSVL